MSKEKMSDRTFFITTFFILLFGVEVMLLLNKLFWYSSIQAMNLVNDIVKHYF
jgi:hypothetical protein